MALTKIITARNGRLLARLISDVAEKHAAGIETLVLVPEQYTLEAERELISGLKVEGLLDVTVLSPTRLNRWVAERAGKSGHTVLNSRGVHMAMSVAVTYAKKDLQYYQSVCERRGFVEKMTALVQTLKNGGLTPESYEAYLDTQAHSAARQMKHQDILSIWRAYEKSLAGRFLDSEDEQEDMLLRLLVNALFKDMAFCVYGFDRLSEKTMRAVLIAAKTAESAIVYMMLDHPDAPDGDIFRPMRASVKHLKRMLETEGLKVKEEALADHDLPAAPALRHLERNLFALTPRPYADAPDGISVRFCLTPYQEAVRAAYEMIRLNELGMPYGQMAVLLCDESRYESFLPAVFKGYGIPFYMARKTPAAAHGLVRFILSALRAVADGYEQQTILEHIKSGYTALLADEGFALENYVKANGITRGKWLKTFARGQDAAQMEALREKLMAPLVALRRGIMEAKTAAESMAAVFALMMDQNAYNKLLDQEKRLTALQMQAEAAQNRQVWQTVLSILDQMAALLDTRRAPGAHAARWLEAGLLQAELSALPPGAEEVSIGAIGHVMTGQVQAVFVLGLQDDALSRASGSLLTDEEAAGLKETLKLPLMPLTGEMNDLARCDLYKAVSMPISRLYLSYSEASFSGEALRPHALISMMLERIFPGLALEGSVLDKPYDPEPVAPMPAMEALAQRLRENEMTDLWRGAYRLLRKDPNWAPMLDTALQALQGTLQAPDLPPEKARPLFAAEKVSITRLERYAECPYRHFVLYGLSPKENEEYVFTPIDRGNFYHYALMGYMNRALKEPGWPNLSREVNDNLFDEAVETETKRWEEGPLYENKRGVKQADIILKTAKRAAWLLLKHAQNGAFQTLGTEVRFGDNQNVGPLVLNRPDGGQTALTGIVDRVDGYSDGEQTYLRIVDYKSSAHALEPSKILGGLQLQLLLYFEAMLSAHPGAYPAGAFYFHVHDPLVPLETDDALEADEKIAAACHLSGLALENKDVVIAMRPDGAMGYSSVAQMLNQNGGDFRKNAPVLTLAEWQKLLYTTRQTAAHIAGEISAGGIAARPSRYGNETACDLCAFQSVCLVDASEEDAPVRRLFKMDIAALKQSLNQE